MKKVLIVGCNGQDGRLLSDLLSKKGHLVFGLDKGSAASPPGTFLEPIDLADRDKVFHTIAAIEPHEIYYLAACHESSEEQSPEGMGLFDESYRVHVSGPVNMLEGIRRYSRDSRFFYAASSHIFGEPPDEPQHEETPINPTSVYGLTKAAGVFACRFFRKTHSVFSSCGILYNHESPLRNEKFVSRKIVKGVADIQKGVHEKLVLGDLSAEADWGYAPDYVDAMYRILGSAEPGDFIIATGIKHSVLDFVTTAFESVGLDWRKYVEEDRAILFRNKKALVGNRGKLTGQTGWEPTMDFSQMIQRLLLDEGAVMHRP